jgi:hypothetical protein
MQGVRHLRAKTLRDAEQVDPFTKKRLLDLVGPRAVPITARCAKPF